MYKIPEKAEVGKAVLEVLEDYREVASQAMLHSLVLERLRKENQFFKISPVRVRKIAVELDGVKLFVEKRKSPREAKKCFICGEEMMWVRGRSLMGGSTRTGKKCPRCGFRIDKPELEPRKYVFYMR
jgi:DNA-directed RNA polymerase subunit RPC12/RpoP